MKKKGKLLIIVSILLLMGKAVAQERALLQDEAAQTSWREDVDYLLDRLIDIHPNAFYRTPEADLRGAAEVLKADIPYLTDNQIIAELARLTAMLDGHTYLYLLQDRVGFHLYPIRLYDFEEGIYVVRAAPEHVNLVRMRLVAVNGVDARTVYNTIAPYSSSDNETYLREWVPLLMNMPELLEATGIIAALDRPNFEFEDEAGERLTISFSPMTFDEHSRWNQGGMMEMIGLPPRETLLYLSQKDENFWLTYLEESQTLYVQYNHVYSMTPSGLTIYQLGNEIETLAAANVVERLVVDIRFNGGGDNTTYGSFISALERSSFNQPGKLFVIIGRMTFSAGKDFALDVAKRTNALFVGEPTGGMPNNYGDTLMVRLPNSGVQVGIARTFVQKGREEDVDPWLAPDIPAPPTAADFFAGRDGALDAILAYEP